MIFPEEHKSQFTLHQQMATDTLRGFVGPVRYPCWCLSVSVGARQVVECLKSDTLALSGEGCVCGHLSVQCELALKGSYYNFSLFNFSCVVTVRA